MCGIIGTTDLKVNLEGAHSLLHHRGPDANGSWQNAKIRLCHTRLSIIDLSEAGTQPMITDSGNAIVFNGEIYNYIELKNELIKKGMVFNSGTDTEVILKGFESEGIGFFNKLVGMWAFAIYDNKTAKIILSRDHFGIKPLYYVIKNDLYFASEIQPLKKISGSKDLNTEKYYQYYNLGYFLDSETYLKDVKRVLPGQIVVYDHRNHQVELFQNKLSIKEAEDLNESECVDLVSKGLQDSVKRHYISDVPVSLLMSGGADSSLIAALSVNLGLKPDCYHISIPGSIDTEYAIAVSKHLGLNLNVKEFNEKKLIELYSNIHNWADSPTSDISILPTALVYQAIGNNTKVALSGEGGDELFGGYLRHNGLSKYSFIGKRNFSLARSLKVNSSFGIKFINPIINRVMRHNDILSEYISLVVNSSSDIKYDQLYSELTNSYQNNPNKDQIPNNLFFDLFVYLPNMLMYKNDICSMHSSVEARVPFLDKIFYEEISRIPESFRLSQGYTNKYLLHSLLKRYLPENLVERPKKGFGFSLNQIGKETLINDFLKAAKFHRDNSQNLGVDKNLYDFIDGNEYLIFNKFPRFAFALIMNMKIIEND